MLRISKLTDYAIVVMVELGESPGAVLSAQALAERSHLELPTVSKVLKLLARHGLVRSYRGAHGGYRVTRPTAEISVAEIIGAIEGPIAMTECSVEVGLCSQEHVCGLRSNWQRISAAVARAMEEVSLAEMSRPARPSEPGLRIATLNA
ncbi:MAG: SUF system Fe-S cluster assembly regulator [Xanthomonadales bacterium]|nr:SUF system Fe-S cluster assembly regulator [Xanthomonadales bacterium]NIN58301.1 SUF system Fe-S cluster assembly regulator [Xanthomonadales bacterium]NIN73646.1 SUF system Fe-S cluster assembly regulator [Xanthomonadales bacterium]NIO14431.1 SUF system Fe-S cluster assembly regulator [Xanthomonadales bacterium]NIP10694.1 SUF system Fe-S cluster assembly regulator [Xanthomonadales bacterium]